MLRIALAEDDRTYREELISYLHRYGEENGLALEVTAFPDAKPLVEGYQPIYDILLLDIAMPESNGMEAAEAIRRVDEQVVIVFITQLSQYAINGYEVGALDFLLKPVHYDTFALKFARAVRRAQSREGGQVTLALHSGLKRLRTRDIHYVEIQNHMLHYYTTEGEYVLRGTMQGAEQELSPYGFAKCNHWYLVNLGHVSEVDKDSVLVAGNRLEISRRNRSAFLAAVTNFVGGST